MNVLKSASSWLNTQFKTHKTRSLLITGAALSVATVGILWAAGVFTPREVFTYLPNRTYRLAPENPKEPETLKALLQADDPKVDTLLRKPVIAQALIQAGALTDIVDSRVALSNLRELDRQLEERISEEADQLELIDLNQVKLDLAASPKRGPVSLSSPVQPASLIQLSTLNFLKSKNSVRLLAAGSSTRPDLKGQKEALGTLKTATTRLLQTGGNEKLASIPSNINIKSVWQSPGEGLVHMVPSGDWLPENGYKLYRVVDGTRTLLAEQLASPGPGLSGALKATNIGAVRELYEKAALTPDKLSSLGMDAARFKELAYQTNADAPKGRVSGELDFMRLQEALITIPADLGQRIPETDLLLRQPIFIMGRQENGTQSGSSLRTALEKKMTVLQPDETLLTRTWKTQLGVDLKANTIRSILTARQQIATLSFVDDEFAEEAGFLFRDDLSSLNLANGKQISYQVETSDGAQSTENIIIGKETSLSKPQGLMGYGIDGKVPIRWQPVTKTAEKHIVSGYWIERKLDGENEFKQINKEPVVISYILDETNVFFESPIFYEDHVDNGRTAEYRIRSFDIFGRNSEYSDSISFKVEKVTPPNAPAIDPPALSTDAPTASAPVQAAISANGGKKGVVLPIYTDSPDTVRFTIYRAVALGAQNYGAPEVLADFTYDNPMPAVRVDNKPSTTPTQGITERQSGIPDKIPNLNEVTKNKARQLLRTNYTQSYPNLVYFDANVEEGHTYKYWVSAWDSWNNESAWSKSASAGVPTDVKPAIPAALNISMLARELPDFSATPPGILEEDLVSFNDIQAAAAGTSRAYSMDVATVKLADDTGVTIGKYTAKSAKYSVISTEFDNLPEDKYIHLFVAVQGEDVLPDSTARLRWPAYSGDGLAGYVVYMPEFTLLPLEQMQQMTRDELVALGAWRRVNDQPITDNQLVVGGLTGIPGSFSLFLICLEPESTSTPATPTPSPSPSPSPSPGSGSTSQNPDTSSIKNIISHFAQLPEGGYVSIEWEAPADPQIKFYRIYRSEVPSFKKPVDEGKLVWTLVGDQVKAPKYTERVEQTFAHYYYYKVTSVTPWGIESDVGRVQRFRVPATKPPQTPNLLLPLSRKDGVEVNFSAVSHCDRYEIYRTEVPQLNEFQINDFKASNASLFSALFDSPSEKDGFFTGMMARSRLPASSTLSSRAPIQAVNKFKTLTPLNGVRIVSNINALGDQDALAAYHRILQEFGPLALAEYSELSKEMLFKIKWTKVGELPSDYDTVEQVGALGLLEPLSIIDTTAVYGKIYLYTVQAWNDDNLGSTRPEPVEASPRRNRPFDPIDGLKSESMTGQPKLSWNPATMPNLDWQKCREDTVGYIVYRSDTETGAYYQASPLLMEPEWTDETADRYAYNWYKVKVLDTGGYLSEFSAPLLIRRMFIPQMTTVIPSTVLIPAINAPFITLQGSRFQVPQGTAFQTTYALTGSEPITVTMKVTERSGLSVRSITLDAANLKVVASNTLPAGFYTIVLKAVNSVGEGTATFTLEVLPKVPSVTPTPIVKPTVTLEAIAFKIASGTDFKAAYTLTGTKPIQLTLLVTKPSFTGAGPIPVTGFTIDETTRTINAKAPPVGTYTGVLTATNAAGKSEAAFTLIVEVRTPPVIVNGNDRYWSFSINPSSSTSFSYQASATGSTPLTWTLEKSTNNFGFTLVTWDIPKGVSINSNGLLTVKQSYLSVGYYVFVIKASNDVGFDRQYVVLNVRIPPRTSLPSPGDNNPAFLSSGPEPSSGFVLLSSTSPSEPTPTPPTEENVERFKSDKVVCLNLILSQVDVTRPAAWNNALAGRPGYAGTALLDIGYKDPIPVSIINADFDQVNGTDRMRMGTVYLKDPVEMKEIGVTLTSMDITPQIEKMVVSGFVKSKAEGQNLIGNLLALEFTDARLRYANILVRSDLPAIRYQQLLIHDYSEFWILLNSAQIGEPDCFRLVGAQVAMKSHLETLNNEGLALTTTDLLAFNDNGQMRGTIATTTDQSLQLLVPGGTALRVNDAALTYTYGSEDPNGHLVGKLVLPFERATNYSAALSQVKSERHPMVNDMDQLAIAPAGDSSVTPSLKMTLQKGLVKFGETVQQNGLRIVPNDLDLQDKCGFSPINVQNWNGKGFLIESSSMTPTKVADRGLSLDLQESQAITVAPTGVTIDLDREHSFPKPADTQTPNETEQPFWVGMVIKGGTLTLPPAFIKTPDNRPVVFNLDEGEMIYDLNGFNYQTFLYSPAGVPAIFGEELGNFTDVIVYDCLLDLYANRVNLEINADVGIDLFLKNRVKVKLYTNKEDNADGQAGQFLCSVAPTLIENGMAEGINVKIDGGWLKPDGMHISGALTIQTEEVTSPDPLAFTDLIVPADEYDTMPMFDPDDHYGSAELDKPVNVNFRGFSMEIRALDLQFARTSFYNRSASGAWIVLKGSTLLSENIPLSSDTTDDLKIECPKPLGLSKVVLEQSKSVLTANFEGCVDVTGVLVPKLTAAGQAQAAGGQRWITSLGPVYASELVSSPGEGLIEFDTDQLGLGFLGQLNALDIKAVTRFGYDMNNSRCYFAVGLIPATSDGALNFGAGDVKNFTGMVIYNMVMSRDVDNKFDFPNDPNKIEDYVKNRPVHTAPDTFFGAGIKGELSISSLCEIRELYFGFDSGPIVDASGGLYLPLDVAGMIAGDGFKKVGSVAITYNHPERYFSFSITIDNIDLVAASVGGSIGFEFSPHLFGVYLGYPETLAGSLSFFRVGIGIGFRVDTEGGSLIKAKLEFGFDKSAEFFIVYLRGYLYVGADGTYYFDGPEGGKFILELYLKGGIEGGIIVAGDKYSIISFYLDARGRLESMPPSDDWKLYCSCTVSYSLDLWLFSVEGSVSASFDTTF